MGHCDIRIHYTMCNPIPHVTQALTTFKRCSHILNALIRCQENPAIRHLAAMTLFYHHLQADYSFRLLPTYAALRSDLLQATALFVDEPNEAAAPPL